jgi:hypothetical protein
MSMSQHQKAGDGIAACNKFESMSDVGPSGIHVARQGWIDAGATV